MQQEARVATAIEIMLLHVDNLKRSYEKEHNELEETRRILIEHKLLVDEPNISHDVRSIRNRSVSVMHSSVHSVSYTGCSAGIDINYLLGLGSNL